MTTVMQKLSEIGEKALIRDFIKPYFNSADDPAGVGDDCAMAAFGNELGLFSTDRVPSDLSALKLGILDYHGLGDYLARLNLSDIAACGGCAVGLLLNLGLPSDLAYEDAQAICRGFGACAARHGAAVLGGDLTSAKEISVSATAIGRVSRCHVLTRRDARPGDSIFASRPVGLTPSALRVLVGNLQSQLPSDSLDTLMRQFTDLEPMLPLGRALSASPARGACMDNTDGIGQTLAELSDASKCAFVVHRSQLCVPPIVEVVSRILGADPLEVIFDAGADLSLVGTLRGEWSNERASAEIGFPLQIIGRVEAGQGIWLEGDGRRPLAFRGWNYFQSAPQAFPGTLEEVPVFPVKDPARAHTKNAVE
jgi:thiamine-monophosphate kinase